jgi:formylmethanofuran dehydrogenase subunit A
MTARRALELATRGGADVLGRTDLGSLEVGKCADLFSIKLNKLEYAGGLHDPVSALVFCAPVKSDYTIVGGKVIVRDGKLKTTPLTSILEGITRDSIMEIARKEGIRVAEERFTRDEIYIADEAFFYRDCSGSDSHTRGGWKDHRRRQSWVQ